jgi:hypothetical protein
MPPVTRHLRGRDPKTTEGHAAAKDLGCRDWEATVGALSFEHVNIVAHAAQFDLEAIDFQI